MCNFVQYVKNKKEIKTMFAFLCNDKGETTCGSDTVVHVDGRLNFINKIEVVRQYRESFRKNFPDKYEFWTHVFFAKTIRGASCNSPYRL
jgi:hypothetical protein